MPGPLLRQLRALRRRLVWIAFCRRLLRLAGWAALALCALVLAGRLVPLPFEPLPIFRWAAAAALAGALIERLVRRVALFEAALAADRALGLKERLSTAITIREPKSEAEAAVLADAAALVQAVRPAQALPARLGRDFKWAATPLLGLVLVYQFMPQFDLLAKKKEEQKKQAVAVEARKETARQLDELAKQLGATTDLRKPELAGQVERELSALAKKLSEQQLDKEQAAAKMDKLAEKVAERRAELEKKLALPGNLQNKGEGKLTRDVAKALEKGNFQQAAKALEELKQKMQQGQLSEQEKAALQKELKSLGAKLGENPALAEALSQAAEKMEKGESNQALAEMEKAGEELGNMQAMLGEMAELDKLKDDIEGRNRALLGKPGVCQGCGGECQEGEEYCESCQQKRGPWKPGDERRRGSGMGGPGIGQGAIAEKTAGPTGTQKKKIKGQLEPGRIIGKLKIPGSQAPGEVHTAYETMRLEYAQKAEDTVQNEHLPLEYRALVRDYFDAIKEKK